MAMCQAELWIPHTDPLHHMCAYSSSRHHIREASCTIHLSASQMWRNHSKETKETREADSSRHPRLHPLPSLLTPSPESHKLSVPLKFAFTKLTLAVSNAAGKNIVSTVNASVNDNDKGKHQFNTYPWHAGWGWGVGGWTTCDAGM